MAYAPIEDNQLIKPRPVFTRDADKVLVNDSPVSTYLKANARRYSALDLHEFMDQYFAELSNDPTNYIPKG